MEKSSEESAELVLLIPFFILSATHARTNPMEMDKQQVPESLGNSMAGYHTRGPTNQHLEIAAKECTRDANKHNLLDQSIRCVHCEDRIWERTMHLLPFVLKDLIWRPKRPKHDLGSSNPGGLEASIYGWVSIKDFPMFEQGTI